MFDLYYIIKFDVILGDENMNINNHNNNIVLFLGMLHKCICDVNCFIKWQYNLEIYFPYTHLLLCCTK